MNLLLDTHALLWWLGGEPMAPEATERIADPETLVAVSAASIWEIEIKRALGKLSFEGSMAELAVSDGFEPLSISLVHAEAAGALPTHHNDPFDRMIVAQAQLEGLTVVTRDDQLDNYEVPVLRC